MDAARRARPTSGPGEDACGYLQGQEARPGAEPGVLGLCPRAPCTTPRARPLSSIHTGALPGVALGEGKEDPEAWPREGGGSVLQGSAPTQAPLPARRTARVLGRGAARGPASALAGGRLPLSFLEKPRVCWWEAGVGRGGMARGAAACRVGGTGEPPSQEAGASLGAAAASSRGDDSAGQCSASPHVPGHRLGRAGAPHTHCHPTRCHPTHCPSCCHQVLTPRAHGRAEVAESAWQPPACRGLWGQERPPVHHPRPQPEQASL